METSDGGKGAPTPSPHSQDAPARLNVQSEPDGQLAYLFGSYGRCQIAPGDLVWSWMHGLLYVKAVTQWGRQITAFDGIRPDGWKFTVTDMNDVAGLYQDRLRQF